MGNTCHGLWVFCEQREGQINDVSFELVSEGRRLADHLGVELSAVCFGHDVARIETLIHLGTNRVYLADDPALGQHNEDAYTQLLAGLIREHKPEIVLAGATSLGRSFIPRVAAILETGLTADSISLEIDPNTRLLLQTRPTYGSNVMATITCPGKRPQMTTVRPHVFRKGVPDPTRKGEIIRVPFHKEPLASRTRVVSFIEDIRDKVALEDADILVCAGRGVGKDSLSMIQELAGVLGAAIGCTRPPVDEGWLPLQRQIGQSGRTVRPRLYFAIGVSGAAQHIVGVQGPEVIVAINEDPNAPIFEVATYGIVGDLNKVVPLLTNRLKKAKGLAAAQ